MLRARLRASSGWSDACILNVSSRGLMINAPAAGTAQGSTIELWHGERLIVATVMWRKGSRAGLKAEDCVPVDDILALSKAPELSLTADQWPAFDRRSRPRLPDRSRARGRVIEFAGTAVIAACLAACAFIMVQQAFVRPLAHVQAALNPA